MPDMGYIPPIQNFTLPGPAKIEQQPGLAQGIAAGLPTGMNMAEQAQKIAESQQEMQMKKVQQNILLVDSLLKNGQDLPGLMPYFWPTIATRMNEISPDYKLDPKNPPEDLSTWSKRLNDISTGVQSGVISMPQAHDATLHLIRQSFPTAQNAIDPTVGTPDAQGPPGPSAPTGALPAEQPPQPPPIQVDQNAVPTLLEAKTKYDQSMALIAGAPVSKQPDLRKQLEESSLGQNYKALLAEHFKSIDEQYSQGQQNNRNQFNQNQDTLRASANTFMSQSEKFKTVADNFSSFNHLMHLSAQMEDQGADTTATVNAEKTALLQFAQMAYPGTGRPGNPEMLESMEKSGPWGTLITQSLNKLDKGDIMTGKQLKGLRQAAVALYQGHEQQQSQLEDTYMQNIQSLGGNPANFIKNVRPQSVASTSKLFSVKSSDKDPVIGHIMHTKKGPYQYIGGDPKSKDNWAYIGEKSE